jgi:hypothetical protein
MKKTLLVVVLILGLARGSAFAFDAAAEGFLKSKG